MVHQEGSLVRNLSIADNVFAGRQPTGVLVVGKDNVDKVLTALKIQ
jgi:ABC-type sugar transport system ATPase subunit